MPPLLLNLPTELIERILTLLCHENAQTIQACRQVCRTLNAIIAQSTLVQYLERLALLGVYDVSGGAASATLALPDRMAALQTWEDSWNALAGGHDGDGAPFWQKRAPDLCIALPPSVVSTSAAVQVRYIVATIIDPDPPVDPEQEEEDEESRYGVFERDNEFSFGPWFIVATRGGFGVRASYSYLDLHGCLGGEVGGREGVPGGAQSGEKENGDRGAGYDRVHWTVIQVPVRNVVAFALSTELDLAVIISIEIKLDGQGKEERATVVRPLRFRDGTPHPCAKAPTMRFNTTGVSIFHWTYVQVLGDFLLLWNGSGGGYGPSRLYLIAWKQGSVTLLGEYPAGKFGTAHMISSDVLALVLLDPPGIELCRVSNMKKEAEEGGDGDGGAPNDRRSRSDGPRIDKLCTLLLPPLRQRLDGTGARVRARAIFAFCTGEHPGHQAFSRGPWSEYSNLPLGRRQMFRQLTKDSILSVNIQIMGCGRQSGAFEFVMRCATLLTYANGDHVVPTATVATDGDGHSVSAQAQVVVGGANTGQDAEGGADGGGVPWGAWGPQATAAWDRTLVGRRFSLLGERMATIEPRICIRDYNPYRIRQARASMVAKGLGGHGWGDSEEEEEDKLEGEGNADTCHLKGTRRITESSTIPGGEWFEEDVTTALPHLEIEVDVPGCRGVYMEQDQVLFRVDDLDKITGRPNMMNGQERGYRESEGFALYRM